MHTTVSRTESEPTAFRTIAVTGVNVGKYVKNAAIGDAGGRRDEERGVQRDDHREERRGLQRGGVLDRGDRRADGDEQCGRQQHPADQEERPGHHPPRVDREGADPSRDER
ncbi:hypothetical protein DEJ15_14810 [Curtobacterium sp. MCJR17_043]|nr:hypothetical protein [Curtobacterium sp. MCJR17_043]WIB35483.1 hypothetical protein DEJ15_14810 [Curtobacterium sp. MCJR17_043]